MITYRSFPTIPIIFVSSVHPDRIPLHTTMGLAVTDKDGESYVETECDFQDNGTTFILNGKEEKVAEIENIADHFRKKSGNNKGVKITSRNKNVYSGSSDAGAAALVFALNDLFETKMGVDELAQLSMKVSESAMRSVYGGMSEINTDAYPKVKGMQIASQDYLKDIKIFAVGFEYKNRVTAKEIFKVARENPLYDDRLRMVPVWVKEITEGLKAKDWERVFRNAEQNCHNAHHLIEYMGLFARRKEMLSVCYDVALMRKEGLKVYWTAGGGNVINVFSWGDDADKVKNKLKELGYPVKEYKVAPGPVRI